jgi:hypothetical protein
MNKHKALTTAVVHSIAGFMSLRIATFALGYASTFLFGGLNRLNIVFQGLRLGMALAGAAFRSFFKIGPLAMIGIAWAIYENWETVGNFLMKIWEKVEPYWPKFKAILEFNYLSIHNSAKNYGTSSLFPRKFNTLSCFYRQVNHATTRMPNTLFS